MEPKEAMRVLHLFEPKNDFFIGIDSDGCVFDTMEIKHKECFIPNTIKFWDLQPVSKYAREAAEFVNLYSKWRGVNRFPALVKSFDLLREREEVLRRNVKIPQAEQIRAFIASGLPLGNPALEEKVEKTNHPELRVALKWSKAINKAVDDMVQSIPPFPYMRECLEKLKGKGDMMVISSTPAQALKKEWEEHGMAPFMQIIAGQEMGSKKEILTKTTSGNYKPHHVLMIGDAPLDFRAAKEANALFYPIIPGREEESWKEFYNQFLDAFLAGEYAGPLEEGLIEEFLKSLPEKPPWEKK